MASFGSDALSSPSVDRECRFPKLPNFSAFKKSTPTLSTNTKLDIYAHEAPPPSDHEFQLMAMLRGERDEYFAEREQSSPMEWVLRHPPLPGSPKDKGRIPIMLRESISTKEGQSCQLFRVELDGHPSRPPLLAKFFDPVFSEDFDNHRWYCQANPFYFADYLYTRESAAYPKLKHLQGSKVAGFYGSYTCALPLPQGLSRDVRLILMEYINGICLRDLEPAILPQATRQNVMRRVIATDTEIYELGVDQDDVYPRNLIARVKDAKAIADPDLEVALVDFGAAQFGDDRRDADLSPSAIRRWGDSEYMVHPFLADGWIDWDWKPWLAKCFAGTQQAEHSTVHDQITD